MPVVPTLEAYYSPTTFVFKLLGDNGILKAVRCPDDPRVHIEHPDAILLSDLPDHHSIPKLDASKIQLIPQPGFEDLVMADIPKKVLLGNDEIYYFKPAHDRESFQREFKILRQLQSTGIAQKFRISRLHALVHPSGRTEKILGMLIEYVEASEMMSFMTREVLISAAFKNGSSK